MPEGAAPRLRDAFLMLSAALGGEKEFCLVITRKMIPEYLKYILPTMLTFTLAGIYSIVDGIFVGHAVGDAGLAGVNVAYPLVCLILAVGTGLGMGGGVISSIARGKGDEERSQRVIGVTLFMLVTASIPILVLYSLFAEPFCAALGGQGETLSQAVYYLRVIAIGAPFQVLVTGCTPLIRNRGQVAYAMAVQLLAGAINAVLDYVFVMQWGRGTAGAGEATVVAQAVAFLFVLAFFLRRANRVPVRDLVPDGSTCAHILKLGAAPFGLTLLPEVSTVVNNISLSYYGGETALAAYAAIAYVAYFVQIMIQSVGDGSQPLISVYRGAGDTAAVRRLRNTNYAVAITLGVAGLALMFAVSSLIPPLFGASETVAPIIVYALPVFSICYIFYGFTHTTTSYFYAVDDSHSSNALVICEAVIVCVVVFVMGRLFQVDGIWLSPTVLQIILSIIAATLLYRRHRASANGL